MAMASKIHLWIVFALILSSIAAETTLRFVTVVRHIVSMVRLEHGSAEDHFQVWRHGDRTPSDGTFPTDTGNGESTWPQGFGELTQVCSLLSSKLAAV